MGKAIGPRLERVFGRIGWRLTTLHDRYGNELTVRSVVLVDAWLAWQLEGIPPTSLPRRVARFLADGRMRQSDGDVLLGLRDACREMLANKEDEA
jgi:hypothetical protein